MRHSYQDAEVMKMKKKFAPTMEMIQLETDVIASSPSCAEAYDCLQCYSPMSHCYGYDCSGFKCRTNSCPSDNEW